MNDMTITAAPQIHLSDALYERWMMTHTGSRDDMLRFLTVPSVDRTSFLASIGYGVGISEGVGAPIYSI